jgi:hypothetical protein
MILAGAPATVRAAIEREMAELGTNYLVGYLFFGTLTYADAKRSLDLFAKEVMPALEKI